MKARDYIALSGGLLLALGTFTLQQDVPKWAWWAANFATIIGPMLLSARAVTAGIKRPPTKPKNKP